MASKKKKKRNLTKPWHLWCLYSHIHIHTHHTYRQVVNESHPRRRVVIHTVIINEGCRFEASLSYTARACLKGNNKNRSQQHQVRGLRRLRSLPPRQMISLIPGAHVGRGEPTFRSCLLTSMCMLWHVSPPQTSSNKRGTSFDSQEQKTSFLVPLTMEMLKKSILLFIFSSDKTVTEIRGGISTEQVPTS